MRDKELFRRQKKELIKSIEKRGINYVSSYCTLAGMPVIIAYEFIMEDYPEHKELCESRIKIVKDFMGYKD